MPIEYMPPKGKYPSLYDILKKLQATGFSEEQIGKEYVRMVAQLPANCFVSQMSEERDETKRQIKKEFQKQVRTLFYRTYFELPRGRMDRSVGAVNRLSVRPKAVSEEESIEEHLNRILRSHPEDYASFIGPALVKGARAYHAEVPDTIQGYSYKIFLEYNRIAESLEEIK